MKSTKSTQSMATKEETEEHDLEQLINLLKRVKVNGGFTARAPTQFFLQFPI